MIQSIVIPDSATQQDVDNMVISCVCFLMHFRPVLVYKMMVNVIFKCPLTNCCDACACSPVMHILKG